MRRFRRTTCFVLTASLLSVSVNAIAAIGLELEADDLSILKSGVNEKNTIIVKDGVNYGDFEEIVDGVRYDFEEILYYCADQPRCDLDPIDYVMKASVDHRGTTLKKVPRPIVEFVVHHFNERTNGAPLTQVKNKLEARVQNIYDLANNMKTSPDTLQSLAGKSVGGAGYIKINQNIATAIYGWTNKPTTTDPVKGNTDPITYRKKYLVHYTVGFKLEEIEGLVEYLEKGLASSNPSLIRANQSLAAAAEVVDEVGGFTNQDQVKGFITLLSIQVAALFAAEGDNRNPKNNLLALSRVPMQTIFTNALEVADQNRLKDEYDRVTTTIEHKIKYGVNQKSYLKSALGQQDAPVIPQSGVFGGMTDVLALDIAADHGKLIPLELRKIKGGWRSLIGEDGTVKTGQVYKTAEDLIKLTNEKKMSHVFPFTIEQAMVITVHDDSK